MSTDLRPQRRLRPSERHAVFGALLDSLANPGKIFRLPRCADIEPAMLPLLCLTDVDVRVALPRGIPAAPEQGGRIIMTCAGFGRGISCKLVGPGSDLTDRLQIDGVALEVFYAIAEANGSRPCGIDAHFIDPLGSLVSIPRTCTVRVEDDAWVV